MYRLDLAEFVKTCVVIKVSRISIVLCVEYSNHDKTLNCHDSGRINILSKYNVVKVRMSGTLFDNNPKGSQVYTNRRLV